MFGSGQNDLSDNGAIESSKFAQRDRRRVLGMIGYFIAGRARHGTPDRQSVSFPLRRVMQEPVFIFPMQ
jgi:hypothetical protein